jgi:hypothetical protein
MPSFPEEALAERARPRGRDPASPLHGAVRSLCLDRLADALDPATSLFGRQLRDGRWAPTLGTEDVTSTAIALVGLHRAGIPPARVGLAPARTLAALRAAARRRRYAGALGLVLWANAVWDDLPLPALLDAVGARLDRPRPLVRRLTTMEVAWLVSGLAHEHARSRSAVARVALAFARGELLSRFRGGVGLFAHASEGAPLAHRARRWIANFADQIYPVQALAHLALHARDPVAIAVADAAAERLVALQGPLGQWWWQYDARDGAVARPFPVYSVHQHAMAPMALWTLAAAGGADHGAAVRLGISWLARTGAGAGMVDGEAGTIWRGLELVEGRLARAARDARNVLGWRRRTPARTPRLRVLRETRPYEWGWCLLAGAIAEGTARGRHVA